jgi:hypothetical protein
MVAVEGNAPGVMAYSTPTATTASAATRTMTATAHTFHVHAVAVTLSHFAGDTGEWWGA